VISSAKGDNAIRIAATRAVLVDILDLATCHCRVAHLWHVHRFANEEIAGPTAGITGVRARAIHLTMAGSFTRSVVGRHIEAIRRTLICAGIHITWRPCRRSHLTLTNGIIITLNDGFHVAATARPLDGASGNEEYTIARVRLRGLCARTCILAPADVAIITAWVVDVPKVDGNGGGASGFAIVVTLSGRRWCFSNLAGATVETCAPPMCADASCHLVA